MGDQSNKHRGTGSRLRQAREYLELTQEEAAKAVGLSRSALSLIENGKRKVDSMELSQFGKLYDQSIQSLTGEEETQPLPKNIHALARAATVLSNDDRDELLRFAEFLQTRTPKVDGRG